MKALFAALAPVVLLAMPAALMAQAGNGSVRGTVSDPDTAIIPGAQITLTPANGPDVVGKSGSDGTYRVSAPAGTYTMTVTMPAFATFSKTNLKIVAGQAVALDAKLIVGDQTTVITVTSDAVSVGVDADSNAAATVIKGKDLEALSDDPDELSSELSALAGPAAGPNGGQIYVDGFTGGQLPPKSSIREIRINQNPFSAQFDRLGFGRIEVFTKPGTDKFHGSLSVQGNDNVLNTSNPFLGAGGTQPPYHTFFVLGSITGPLTKFSSFSVGGSRRTIQNNVIVDPTGFYSTSATSTTPCDPGPANLATCGSFAFPSSARAVFQPQLRQDITPRLDFAIGPKNVLTVRYQYEGGNTQNGGGGGNSLLSTFNNNSNNEQEIQISDTQTVSPSVVNETRFEYQRGTSQSTALTAGPTVSVQGNFTSGGSGTQAASSVSTHIEVQNYSSIALAKHFMRFGGRLRTTSDSSTNLPNANGSFTYNFLLDPCSDPSVTNKPSGCVSTTTPCLGATGYVSSYQCGTVSQFRFTSVTRPTVQARSTDVGLYFEDDWKIRPNLTLSVGTRFETQNTVSKHDIAPRLSVAYGIPRSGGKAPVTVLRVGFGLFYDRFNLNDFLTVQQFAAGGPAQQQYTVINPNALCRPGIANPLAVCGGGVTPRTTSYTLNPNLRAPYTMQAAIGVDQQLGHIGTLSINYLPSRGNHQYLTRLYLDDPTRYKFDYQSTGVFRENQLFINTNIRTKKLTMFGFYALNFAKTNTSGSGFIPTSTNPAADYGRASFANRHQFVAGASYTAPYKVTVSPFTIFRAGSPYNITTGLDNNGDNVYNDRPAFANGSSANCALASSFQQNPSAGYTEIPINYCTGPTTFTFNLRAARTFGFGPKLADASAAGGGDGGGRGGPGGGRGGSGGGHGGGGPMGGFGGGTGTGRRYNLTLGAQAQNLFNVVPYAPPTATSSLTSTQFGKLTQLVGRPFSTPNAVRLIQLQATFNF